MRTHPTFETFIVGLLVAGVATLYVGCAVKEKGAATKGPACQDTPTLLVDYASEVPEAGRTAIQVPDIAVNSSYLFYALNWSTPSTATSPAGTTEGYLMRVPLRGGAAVRLALIRGGGSPGAQGLAATHDAVIFSAAKGSDSGGPAIMIVPPAGGTARVLTVTHGLAYALVTDNEKVYFADDEATKSVSLAGGRVQKIAAVVPYSLGISEHTLFLADFGADGAVSSVGTGGGPLTSLAKNQSGALYPLACGKNVCWATAGAGAMSALAGTLMQVAPHGEPVVLAHGLSEPHALVFDGKNFFVTTGGGGIWIERISAAGGSPVIAEAEANITGLAVDDSCLYWSSARGISSLSTSAADVAAEAM